MDSKHLTIRTSEYITAYQIYRALQWRLLNHVQANIGKNSTQVNYWCTHYDRFTALMHSKGY